MTIKKHNGQYYEKKVIWTKRDVYFVDLFFMAVLGFTGGFGIGGILPKDYRRFLFFTIWFIICLFIVIPSLYDRKVEFRKIGK